MTRVLVAVDETERSLRAAEVAYRLFGDTADYLAVSVANSGLDAATMGWWGAGWGVAYPRPYGAVWPYRTAAATQRTETVAGAMSPMTAMRDAAVSEAQHVADAAGLPDAEIVGDIGDPARTILDVAASGAVDVIVVGSHNRGWFDRLLHASVSKDVVRNADIPVLVVN